MEHRQLVMRSSCFLPDVVPTPPETIVDNQGATLTGAWRLFELDAELITDRITCSEQAAAPVANTIRWTPPLTQPGRYFVYYRLPDGMANRAPDAPFVLAGAGGTQTVKVDQHRQRAAIGSRSGR